MGSIGKSSDELLEKLSFNMAFEHVNNGGSLILKGNLFLTVTSK